MVHISNAMIDRIYEMWHSMLRYCHSEEFDQKMFGTMVSNFNHTYKRCSVGEQGEYHRRISLGL